MNIKEKLEVIVKEKDYKPLGVKELKTMFRGKEQEIDTVLTELETEGILIVTNKGKLMPPYMANMMVGILEVSERGFGFVDPIDEEKESVFIGSHDLNGAMNKDRVLVRIKNKSINSKKAEGEVAKVLYRANSTLVGTFEKSRNFGFVIPDDRRINGDIFISRSNSNKAVNDDKVLVEIIDWGENGKKAEGKIIEVLGKVGAPGVDVLSVVKSFGINDEFPEEVYKQVASIPKEVQEDQIKNRKDLRNLRIVTIDGDDAKDLDDAISIEYSNGIYKLGVHIADVGHYVTEGSPLDKEAVDRGTSVYFVDRVIPMLPKELSNGICSLNAGVDRLAFTVMMDVDKHGKVISHEIFKSIIRVSERMTYKNVTKILVDKDTELMERYKNHLKDFDLMLELCNILKEKRTKRGSIDFDFPEVKVILDENGKPIDVTKYEITISNKIIEEFMLLCNETVAERFFWANAPFMYRIHELPDSEKIEGLNKYLFDLGLSIKGANNIHPRAMQDVLNKIKGSPEERIISTLMLRSLQQAKYSHKNEGHFGLAAEYYCHFTSPIRRYPDLFIHRVMGEMIENNFVLSEGRLQKLSKYAEERAKSSSETERTAEMAEREVDDLKKVEFMVDKVGEVFDAIISSVTSFGFFVELDNLIEGLVRAETIRDDYYVFDEKKLHLIGERTKKMFKIGDTVKVRLVRADVATKKIDFELESEDRAIERKVKRKLRI